MPGTMPTLREMRRIRWERVRRGWTQVQVAERAGLRQTTVSAIEIGKLLPTAAEIERLAATFGVTSAELMQPAVAVVASDFDHTEGRSAELVTP